MYLIKKGKHIFLFAFVSFFIHLKENIVFVCVCLFLYLPFICQNLFFWDCDTTSQSLMVHHLASNMF